jgi:hypothetical protein
MAWRPFLFAEVPMDKPALSIQAGKNYYVQYAGIRFKVRVLRPAVATPGWWLCETSKQEQAVFPESAFLREAAESPLTMK